ncbi:hypothetical protein GW796_10885 [archaeon]|nr:hypothetical protein [archaeon]
MNSTQSKSLVNTKLYDNDKTIINDTSYLLFNFRDLKMNLKDYPESIKSNDFFLYEYFSKVPSNKKEYKLIPPHLLKSTFFVAACLKVNPDIYLLADKSCHTNYSFDVIKVYHPSSYMKYANESDLNNKEFCLNSLSVSTLNYQFFPNEIKEDFNICNIIVKKDHALGKFVEHIPESKIKDTSFVKSLIKTNVNIFKFLPSEYRSNEDISLPIIRLNTNFFIDLDISLKENENFINEVFKYYKKTKNIYDDFSKFNIKNVIAELPLKFFTPTFCQEYKKEIKSLFKSLPKQHRGDINVIRSVYLENEKAQDIECFQSIFLNKITDLDLQQSLKNFCKQFEVRRTIESQQYILKFLDKYHINKELKESLEINEGKVKKIKI